MRTLGHHGQVLQWRATTKIPLFSGRPFSRRPFSRRAFLRGMRWAPVLFLPAPMLGSHFRSFLPAAPADQNSPFPFADFRLTPHYPAKSPLDDVLRLVLPGSDEYVTEKYTSEILPLLDEWSRGIRATPPAPTLVAKFLDASIEATSLLPTQEIKLRSGDGIDVFRRRFAANVITGRESGRERFLAEIKTYLAFIDRRII